MKTYMSKASFGVLTIGYTYNFHVDLEKSIIMNEKTEL
ncbi:hypothetical protein BN1088_1700001 [Sphingobacterium sp. PM2-P1-29]|nr:hypothetical protein BN1088_1700001 [Sphingobacterium sp. PM2-P1-29]